MASKSYVWKYFTKINKTEVKIHFEPENTNITKPGTLYHNILPSTSKGSDTSFTISSYYIFKFTDSK